MILWSNLEYVALRLIRRFLFSSALLDKIGAYVPYWRTNQGLLDPEPIVSAYQRLARLAVVDLHGKRVVELGCGATNATGYEWTARFGGEWLGVEPFALFDTDLDRELKAKAAARHPGPDLGRVGRLRDLQAVETGWADIIVSNSVLEHVRDPLAAFRECHRALAQGGIMIHRVDYRDHFFKYPFHFLTFSKDVWDNLLDPGDLPRFRLDDHLNALERCGFTCQVLEGEADPKALAAVQSFLAPEFSSKDKAVLATTLAALVCGKA